MIGLVFNNSSPLYLNACEQFKKWDEHFLFDENKLSPMLEHCDSFVLVGNDIFGRPVKEYVYKSGKPFFVITGNYFNIKDDGYVRILVNGYLNNFGQVPNVANVDRWEQIRQHYKLRDSFKRKEGGKIVIALNSKHSPSLFKASIEEWVVNAVTGIRKVTNKPIVIRHHRKQKVPYSNLIKRAYEYNDVNSEMDCNDSNTSLNDTDVSVTFNSTYSVLSLQSGVINIATHPGSPVYNIVKNDFSSDSLNYYPDENTLRNYFATVSNCHWKVNEIAGNTFRDLYEPLLKENRRENFHWLG